MQGGAEFGAIVGEDTIFGGVKLESCRFTRLDTQVDVVIGQRETVRRVIGAFDVGNMPGDVIAFLDIHTFGCEVAANGRHRQSALRFHQPS